MPDEKPPPLDSELGSTLSWADSLFTDYLNPTIGSVAWYEARDIGEMLKTDGQARKVETVLTQPLYAAGHSIEGAKGDKGEAEWVTEVLERPANNGGMSTPLELVIAQMTTAVSYRVASFEKVWTQDDAGDFVYDKLAFRPAVNTRVMRDRKTGAYLGLEQDAPYAGAKPVKIPAKRAFTHIHGQHRAPVVGASDMEIPLTCWRTKQKLKFLWFLFLELQAQPRVGFESAAESPNLDGATKAARAWSKMRAGGSIPLPPGVKGTVLEAGGRAAELYQAALKYLDGEMTGQVLADFANLAGAAADGRGSFALSRDQSDFYMMTRETAAREMAGTLTNYVLADLVKWKFGPTGKVPRFVLGPLVRPDLETLLTALGTMFVPGTLPHEFTDYIIESTAQVLEMPTDKVAAMVKAMEGAADRAAATPAQAQLARVAAPVAAADQLVRGTDRGRAAIAAAGSRPARAASQ